MLLHDNRMAYECTAVTRMMSGDYDVPDATGSSISGYYSLFRIRITWACILQRHRKQGKRFAHASTGERCITESMCW